MAGPAQRIKGQEVFLDILVDGQIQDLGPVESFEAEFMLELISKPYIGESTERKDSTFKGIKGSCTININTKRTFDLVAAAVDKARRRTPGTVVNAKATFSFPNGERARLMFPNLEFGTMPLNFGGKDEYGELKLEWEASEYRVLTV